MAPPDRWDRLGIIASLGCAVHCLVAPFLLLLLPSLGSVWSHPAAHWILAAFVLPLAGIVVWRGYGLHRKRSALVAAGLGMALIFAGLVLPVLPTDATTSAGVEAVQIHHAGSGFGLLAEPFACTDSFCCPTLTQDPVTGDLAMNMPAGGMVTLIGSVLLVIAHGVNLWGCRCVARTAHEAGTCGCPAHA
ncbi:MAG: MerC domain-containing protein [Planctomycetota bacterium]